MASKFLSNLSNVEYKKLTKRLLAIQNNKCFICMEEIDPDIHETNIDHIIPLANKGRDNQENFAVTHSSCNKSKQDANLKIARILYKLKKIQDDVYENENRTASLKDILNYYDGSKYEFKYKIDHDRLNYSFSKCGDNTIYSEKIYDDPLSNESFTFIKVPIEYIYHDEIINPRGINNSISKLIKEFDKGNPQLHLSLARIDNGKILIFDGQHKAVAQLLLGIRELVLRVFINPDIDRLTETNTNAGSILRQVAFDKSIMRQLNNTLYYERIKKYQEDHNLNGDDYSFSEQELVEYFKGENVNIKKYITDSIKHSVTYNQENKLKDYIDFGGKSKDLPISYSAFDKTFLSRFINTKVILSTPINYKTDIGLNPRELEINQFVKLLNIIAEEIYINKFLPEVGMNRIEQKIIDGRDLDITDDHLVAYRISKEEVMYNWLNYLQNAIINYFSNKGQMIDTSKLLQYYFDDQLWTNIRNFIQNLKSLSLWKDRSMSSTVFAGKNNYDYWKTIFQIGKSPDGVQVLIKPLNFVEMIKPLHS
jgi:hypothetical protein